MFNGYGSVVEMAGDKVSISQLSGENWSTWKAKFRGLLAYKGAVCTRGARVRGRTESVKASEGVDANPHG